MHDNLFSTTGNRVDKNGRLLVDNIFFPAILPKNEAILIGQVIICPGKDGFWMAECR